MLCFIWRCADIVWMACRPFQQVAYPFVPFLLYYATVAVWWCCVAVFNFEFFYCNIIFGLSAVFVATRPFRDAINLSVFFFSAIEWHPWLSNISIIAELDENCPRYVVRTCTVGLLCCACACGVYECTCMYGMLYILGVVVSGIECK